MHQHFVYIHVHSYYTCISIASVLCTFIFYIHQRCVHLYYTCISIVYRCISIHITHAPVLCTCISISHHTNYHTRITIIYPTHIITWFIAIIRSLSKSSIHSTKISARAWPMKFKCCPVCSTLMSSNLKRQYCGEGTYTSSWNLWMAGLWRIWLPFMENWSNRTLRIFVKRWRVIGWLGDWAIGWLWFIRWF